MPNYTNKAGLSIDSQLVRFIEDEALPGLPVSAERFWSGLAGLVRDFVPRNAELLAFRDELQTAIDQWHRDHGAVASDPAGYEAFLRDIGYLVHEPGEFAIETAGLDPEITTICGPQLVVPVNNAR